MQGQKTDFIKKLHESQEKKDLKKQGYYLEKLGDLEFEEGNFYIARNNYLEVLKISPNEKKINLKLAKVELNLENIILAQDYLKKERRINPQSIEVRNLMRVLEIHKNYPVFTISIVLLNIFLFFFLSFEQISFENLLKFSVSSNNIMFSSLFISNFIHYNFFHFGVNMVIFLMFGLILEKQIGSLRFILLFLISGILGNLSQALLVLDSYVLGASSAIFAVFGSLMMLKPTFEIKVLGLVKLPLIIFITIFFLISDFLLGKFVLIQDTANIGHIVGFLSGIFITAIFFSNTIRNFYYWILITFGFILIYYSIQVEIFSLFEILKSFFVFFIGIFIIFTVYKTLKKIELEVDK